MEQISSQGIQYDIDPTAFSDNHEVLGECAVPEAIDALFWDSQLPQEVDFRIIPDSAVDLGR